MAKGIEGLTGYTQMHKEELLAEVCKQLGIDPHEHHSVVGMDKTTVKSRIRQLKVERAAALAAKDPAQVKQVRRKIHGLKRQLRRATV